MQEVAWIEGVFIYFLIYFNFAEETFLILEETN